MADFEAVFARFYNSEIEVFAEGEVIGDESILIGADEPLDDEMPDYEDIGKHTLASVGRFKADVQPYTGLSSQNTGAGLFHDFGMLDTSVKRVFAPSEAAGAVVIGNIIEYGGEMYEVVQADARDMGVSAYIRKREVQGYGEELTY